MADAEFTFKASGAETVVAANKKIEQSMQQQAKASSKSGYAVLEASRALEDFSMAGMRGALNNIPQLLLNLGVGAGLTGVLGALTVVVWKGVDALDVLIDKMRDAEMAGSKIGLKSFNAEGIEEAFSEQAVKNAKEIQASLDKINDSMQYLNHLTAIYNTETASTSSLSHAKEMLELTKQNADENEIALAVLRSKIELEEESRAIAHDKVTQAEALLEEELKLKRAQEDIIGKSKEVDLESIDKQRNQFYVSEAKRLMAEKMTIKNPISGAKGGSPSGDIEASRYTPMEAMDLARENAEKYRDELLKAQGVTEKDAVLAIQNAATAKEAIKLIDIEIEKKTQALKIAKDLADSADKTTDQKVEELKIEAEIEALKKKRKKEEEEQKKADAKEEALRKKMEGQKAIDASVFLSNQGRAGLAGNEARVAMDTLGIAKMSLDTLKQIARNTSNGTTTVYG